MGYIHTYWPMMDPNLCASSLQPVDFFPVLRNLPQELIIAAKRTVDGYNHIIVARLRQYVSEH